MLPTFLFEFDGLSTPFTLVRFFFVFCYLKKFVFQRLIVCKKYYVIRYITFFFNEKYIYNEINALCCLIIIIVMVVVTRLLLENKLEFAGRKPVGYTNPWDITLWTPEE